MIRAGKFGKSLFSMCIAVVVVVVDFLYKHKLNKKTQLINACFVAATDAAVSRSSFQSSLIEI